MFRSVLNEDTPIQISGNGIIRKNGQTSLKIQVEIGPAGGQVGGVGAGQFPVTEGRPPRIGAGRQGRRPGAGGRRPGAWGRRPGAGGRGPGTRPGAGGRGPGRRPGAGAGVPGGPGAGTELPGGGKEEGPGAGIEGPGEEGPGVGIGGPETGGESITRSSMFFFDIYQLIHAHVSIIAL